MKDQIIKLRNEGKTYNEIKEILNCSKGTISYHCGIGQKEKYRQYNLAKKEKNRNWLNNVKDALFCTNCGEDRNWLLDFHHIDPSKKEGPIGKMLYSKSKKKILEEIDKCIVLCANCHRDLHYHEIQNRNNE